MLIVRFALYICGTASILMAFLTASMWTMGIAATEGGRMGILLGSCFLGFLGGLPMGFEIEEQRSRRLTEEARQRARFIKIHLGEDA